MKTSSKIALSVFLLALIGLGVWGYTVVGDRYKQTPSEEKTTKEKSSNEQPGEISSGSAEEIFTEEPLDETEESDEASAPQDTFVQVTDQDCKNECKGFQLEEDVTYCKQVCGLTAPKKGVSGCEDLKDLEKDYCYKDLAISKNDAKICDKIDDAGIEKTCKNRFIEDIVDQQMKIE